MSAILLSRRLAIAAFLFVAGDMMALADPPGRVGRLSYIEGAVSFHAADQDQWSPAVLNYPVTTGASFWTEPAARAEIEIGAVTLRMDQSTEIDMLRLDDSATEVRLDSGVVNVHARELPPGGVEVETEQGPVSLLQPGRYHIAVDGTQAEGQAGEVHVAVLEGAARISGPRASLDVQAGEGAAIGGDPVSFGLEEISSTPFDDWALDRERRDTADEADQYVSPEMTGYQDLDAYGTWQTAPTYGPVWYPTAVPAGWAPYRFGHWAFIPPWGWTWIDDAPWGFAPFHYGRWVFINNAWAWCPGQRVRRPFFAPALVVFVGDASWRVGRGAFPAVGWVPLAPFEVFHPHFRASATFLRNVNITSVRGTVVGNLSVADTPIARLANRRAATVISAEAFTNAASVRQATLAVSREELFRAPVTTTMTHLRPGPIARVGVAGSATRPSIGRPNDPVALARPAPRPGDPVPTAPGPSFSHRSNSGAFVHRSSPFATGASPLRPAPGASPARPGPTVRPPAPVPEPRISDPAAIAHPMAPAPPRVPRTAGPMAPPPAAVQRPPLAAPLRPAPEGVTRPPDPPRAPAPSQGNARVSPRREAPQMPMPPSRERP